MAQVYVSAGSNIDREYNIRSGIRALRDRFGELLLSSVHDCPAIGFEGDDFYNLVVGFETDETVEQVSEILNDIERDHRRSRSRKRFVSRTLDLDLLLYDNLILNDDKISLPRNDITRYAFVLGPLTEIAGERRHPFNGKRFSVLWDGFDASGQPMQVLMDFDWEAQVQPQSRMQAQKQDEDREVAAD